MLADNLHNVKETIASALARRTERKETGESRKYSRWVLGISERTGFRKPGKNSNRLDIRESGT